MLMYIYFRRTREKLGVVRVSTAYQFFEAVEEHLVFEPQKYTSKAKPPFEATGYKLYYYAANEADEAGKERISFTLNRSDMWNCTVLHGSSNAYEFVGLPRNVDNKNQIAMRWLPCPCKPCFEGDYNSCKNSNIVGDMEADEMKVILTAECPDRLDVPLTDYTVLVLKAFIVLHKEKLPKKQTKPELIRYISSDEELCLLINYNDLYPQ